MARRVRLGLIGCGGFMHEHVRRLEGVTRAQIVALAEPSDASLQRITTAYPALADVPAFSDHREMLAAADIDGAIISSPHSFHFQQIMDCLDAGVNILCEKPMVCNVDQAKKVMRKAERKGLLLMTAYQRHTMPIFRHARKLIADGKLGRVIFVSALLAQEWLVGCKGTWRQDPDLSCGGELNDSGSHMIDIILWVTGLAADSVFARIDNRGAKVDILSALTVRFKGGAIGNLSVVGDAPGWWEEITFYGERGALYIRGGRLYHHVPRKGRGWAGAEMVDLSNKLRGGSNPDANFVRAILGLEEPQTPAVCGLRVAEVTQAAWDSARLAQPVKVK